MNEPKTASEYADMVHTPSRHTPDYFFRQAMLQARMEAIEQAAIRAGAIGPCSGTRDWNESRIKASKDAVEMILALRNSKKLEDF